MYKYIPVKLTTARRLAQQAFNPQTSKLPYNEIVILELKITQVYLHALNAGIDLGKEAFTFFKAAYALHNLKDAIVHLQDLQ